MPPQTKIDSDDSSVLTDQVVARLEELVLSGRYKPGEKLREQSVAEELGVSRAPLREAIRTLEGRRLLKRTPRSGVEVIGLTVGDVDQILLTREALEGMAARLAAENMTSGELKVLRDTVAMVESRPLEATGAAIFSGESHSDNDFHRLIAIGSRNEWLANILMKDIYTLLRLYRIQACARPEVAESLAEHHAIIDRIHARDADGAEALMREHMKHVRERTLQVVRAPA